VPSISATPLTDAQRDLAAANVGIAGLIAGEFCGRGVHYDDLLGEALDRLMHATRYWRPDGGANFCSFAGLSIRRALQRFVAISARDAQRLRDLQPPDETVSGGQDTVDADDFLRRSMQRLPEAEREVLRLRYWRNVPVDECAVILGVHRHTVLNRHKSAIKHLRELAA
jgi:RNA polymerase sigma factor (sigma-70 family)